MVFSSQTFLFLILPAYLLFDAAGHFFRSCRWRNIALLAVSLLFYIWGEATNVFLLAGMGILTYEGGRRLSAGKNARVILAIFVTANLAVLIGF